MKHRCHVLFYHHSVNQVRHTIATDPNFVKFFNRNKVRASNHVACDCFCSKLPNLAFDEAQAARNNIFDQRASEKSM